MPRQDIISSGILEETVVSATRTAIGNSGAIPGWGLATRLRAQLDVTAAAGTTPTLDAVIEDTLDGVNYNVVGTFAQRTGAGREVINITATFSETMRVRWTIGGTSPSFTFGVRIYSE